MVFACEKERHATHILILIEAQHAMALFFLICVHTLFHRYMFIFNRFGVAVNRVQLDVQDYHSPVWLPCGTLLCAAGSSIYSWSTTASCDPKQPPTVCPMEVLPGRNGAKITACGASELRLAVGYDDGTVKIFFGTPQVGLGCSRVIHQADPVSKVRSTSAAWTTDGPAGRVL